jgi:mannose-6-phosphate isomerase-like protein (cupin superfamily)
MPACWDLPGWRPSSWTRAWLAFVPAGYPHVIENMGRQSTAVFLQAFAPPGPERVYRDSTDARGRADFEVIRDSATRPKSRPRGTVMWWWWQQARWRRCQLSGERARSRFCSIPRTTGSEAVTVNLLEFPVNAELPRHDHGRSTEILYVVAGEGKLTVGSEEYPFTSDSVLYLPAGQPHAIKFTLDKTDKTDNSHPGPRDWNRGQPGRAGQVRGQGASRTAWSLKLAFSDAKRSRESSARFSRARS